MIKSILLVGFGGMVGSMLRYLLVILFKEQSFPYATLIVNVAGSFVIGVIAALVLKNQVTTEARLFVATGICGGFTTFSAFSMETLQLMIDNRYATALLYIAVSLFLGIGAAFAGWVIVK